MKSDDQFAAKEMWCYEEIIKIQDKFITSFYQLKAENFYEGWCTLEQVEISIKFLKPHFHDNSDEFHVTYISKCTIQYQSLFPYKIFMSPEILEIEKICNICSKKISIRNPCGHQVGEIYNGKLCGRIVTQAKALGMAMVEEPLQKYSVPFIVDPKGEAKKDHYNYSLIKYLIKRLDSPFHGWAVELTKRRQPHSRYTHVGKNDKCPCGSGKKYKKCCLLEKGVLGPHCVFTFEIQPREELLGIEYT